MRQFVKLNSGHLMPLVGLGCWQSPLADMEKAADEALQIGYRHFDTAYAYQNEEALGNTLNKWLAGGNVRREELFIVTKLPPIGMRTGEVEKFLRKSLEALQIDYVDLYLIHVTVGFLNKDDKDIFPRLENGKIACDFATDLIAVWKDMEKMVDLGLTKSIGLSNFNSRQIRKIIANARIKPAVLQVECHGYFQQKPLREFCSEHGIVVTAYAPLGSPGRIVIPGSQIKIPSLLSDPVAALVAKNHDKTPAQILLRFLYQQEIVVIPKSTNPDRLKQNFQLFDFDLTTVELEALKSIDKCERSFSVANWTGCEEHPEEPFLYIPF